MKENLLSVKTKLPSPQDIKGPDGLPLLPIPGVGSVGDPKRSRNARVQAYVSLYVPLKNNPIRSSITAEIESKTHPPEEDLY